MELLLDGPAALGGMMMSVALGAWSLGRWQGSFAVPEDAGPRDTRLRDAGAPDRPGAVAEPGPQAARAERRSALAVADSLGELHAEISAYRRAEQVLAGPDGEGLHLRLHREDARNECRYLGVMGAPTCEVAEPVRAACACGTRCGKADPLPAAAPAPLPRLRQPSPAAGLTRV